MQAQQPSSPKTQSVPAPKQQPKATWHRPTITFVPLQTTALKTGSFIDGSFSTVAN